MPRRQAAANLQTARLLRRWRNAFGGYGGAGKIPDVMMWSERDYGNRIGVWRLMEVLDR